jgi:hypothetical protein
MHCTRTCSTPEQAASVYCWQLLLFSTGVWLPLLLLLGQLKSYNALSDLYMQICMVQRRAALPCLPCG